VNKVLFPQSNLHVERLYDQVSTQPFTVLLTIQLFVCHYGSASPIRIDCGTFVEHLIGRLSCVQYHDGITQELEGYNTTFEDPASDTPKDEFKKS
jgi:hypothetical protein